MTCNNCIAVVADELSKVDGIKQIDVNLERSEAQISMSTHIPLDTLKLALPDKYLISEKGNHTSEMEMSDTVEKSKLQQLKPLLLIFLYFLNWLL